MREIPKQVVKKRFTYDTTTLIADKVKMFKLGLALVKLVEIRKL